MIFKQRFFPHPENPRIVQQFPWSLDEARAYGYPMWCRDEPCPRCGQKYPLFYVRSGLCQGCAYRDFNDYFALKHRGTPLPDREPRVYVVSEEYPFTGMQLCPHGPHSNEADPATGECLGCARELGKVSLTPAVQMLKEAGAWLSREQAQEAGYTLYLGGSCGKDHPGWRYCSTGRCYHCVHPKIDDGKGFTLEESLDLGRARYYSYERLPCKHFGWRRTLDGGCEECARPRPHVGRPPSQVPKEEKSMRGPKRSGKVDPSLEDPEMIISRDDAHMLGYRIFRTGKECLNGHAGWRRVDSGACVECMKERRNRYK